jgi:signal peptidase II
MRILLNSLIVFAFIVADQISKWFVTEHILRAQHIADGAKGMEQPMALFEWMGSAPERLSFTQVPVTDFFNWVMVWNRGISFGLFNNGSDYGAIILTILSLVIVGAFIMWLRKIDNCWQRAGILMVIGGALGNVIDRLRFGAVADFIDIHVMGYHWPAFNVADSLICVGVCILLIYAVFFEKEPQGEAQE